MHKLIITGAGASLLWFEFGHIDPEKSGVYNVKAKEDQMDPQIRRAGHREEADEHNAREEGLGDGEPVQGPEHIIEKAIHLGENKNDHQNKH